MVVQYTFAPQKCGRRSLVPCGCGPERRAKQPIDDTASTISNWGVLKTSYRRATLKDTVPALPRDYATTPDHHLFAL